MKLSATGESQPHYIYAVILITGLFYLAGCGVSDEGSGGSDIETEQQWLIPEQEVVDGGPGRDGIPSIDNPTFESASQIGWIGSNRRITALN
ncbi:MAG: hypothetical protein R3211_10645, partial [Balneolaceae bacterium]|nr:hypothetical protein [Balneolaceae bacterium]